MSTKPHNDATTDGPGCGRLGCGDPAIVILDHPRFGYRAVCNKHTVNRWVVDYV